MERQPEAGMDLQRLLDQDMPVLTSSGDGSQRALGRGASYQSGVGWGGESQRLSRHLSVWHAHAVTLLIAIRFARARG